MSLRNKKIAMPLLVIVLTVFAGIILQPRLANQLIPAFRIHSLDAFIQKSVSTKHVDRNSLWEFRDMYSFGEFSLEADKSRNNPLLSLINIDFVPQLSYSSRFIQSLGGQTNLDSLQTLSNVPDSSTLVKTASTVIFKNKNGDYVITLTPLQEEMKINGFIKKIKLVDGRSYWLEINKIN